VEKEGRRPKGLSLGKKVITLEKGGGQGEGDRGNFLNLSYHLRNAEGKKGPSKDTRKIVLHNSERTPDGKEGGNEGGRLREALRGFSSGETGTREKRSRQARSRPERTPSGKKVLRDGKRKGESR